MAVITGTSGNDTLTDTPSNDTINGLGGNDSINGGSGGTDVVDGGDGRDSLLFMSAVSPVLVDFGEGVVAGGRPTSDVTFFTNIERAVTGDFNDELRGNAAAQNLTARAGMDTLWGAGGFDTLWGGSGADTFVFRETGGANADNIGDWTSGSDKLLLDASVMTALGAGGNFSAGDARFKANSTGTATDSTDRIVYNTTTRQIFYDADGNGSGGAQLIAMLQSGATLVATDIIVEGGGAASIVGTEGNDTLSGTTGDDTIEGLGGHDELRGLQGADLIRGGAGNDTLFAHSDSLDGFDDGAVDTLDGGLGDDEYHVSGQDGDTILADPGGIDTVFAWNSSWTLGPGLDNLVLADTAGVGSDGTGNELDNRIESTGEGGNLFGLGGNDTLVVQNVHNTVGAHGGDGNDTLHGGSHADGLFGDAGNDLLVSNDGLGDLTGGTGADTFFFNTDPENSSAEVEAITDFTSGTDTIRLDASVMSALGASGRFSAGDSRFVANSSGTAQDASDRIVYNTSTGELLYDADGSGAGSAATIVTLQGAPSLAAADIEVVNGAPPGQVITGTSGNDVLADTAGSDTINGLGGNDTINGGSGGSDVVDGGTGRDSLMFMAATSAVVVNFGTGTVTGGGPGSTSFTNIERVVTGDFNDQLTGNAAAQNLTARAGADTLAGAGGIDTLWGGAGPDTFIFRENGAANADVIGDWTSGSDEVALDNAAMAALGADGAFVAGDARFWSSSAGVAHDANDRVIYNTSSGQLYYDADGNGSGAAQLIATFTGSPTVAATDISVI